MEVKPFFRQNGLKTLIYVELIIILKHFCKALFCGAGIVVEDCLLLLLNLLKNNSSNQNFFKEGSYIQRMKPWFEVGDDNSGWSAQKVTNLHLMLQVTLDSRVDLVALTRPESQ